MKEKNGEIIFSIIMPCYNSQAYVKQAVDSVLGQTYERWELIAVNDGSTDSTLSILQNYAESDSRIRVFSKENGGYVSAVNFGLDYVEGDYFLFLGSDDRLSSQLFQTITEKITDEMPDMIGFQTMKHLQDKKEIDEPTSFDVFAAMFHTNIVAFQKAYPEQSAILYLRDTAKCFKRSLLGETRYFGKTGLDADGIFTMKLANKADSFMAVPFVGYHWTIRSDSVSGRPVSKEVYLDRIGNWIDFYQNLMSMRKEQLAWSEVFYISHFVTIMQNCYSHPENRKYSKETVNSGIACVNRLIKQYKILLPISYRLFLMSPIIWCYQDKAARFLRRIRRKIIG